MTNALGSQKALQICVKTSEIFSNLNSLNVSYEELGLFLFQQLRSCCEQLRLYVVNNHGEYQEEVVCSDSGVYQGFDIIPKYQLPDQLLEHQEPVYHTRNNLHLTVVPLTLASDSMLVGFIELRSHNPWNKRTVATIQRVGQTIALGISYGKLIRDDQKIRRFISRTALLTEHLHHNQTVDELVNVFLSETVNHLEFDRVTIHIYGDRPGENLISRCAISTGQMFDLHKHPLHAFSESKSVSSEKALFFHLATHSSVIGEVLFDNLYSQFMIPNNYREMLIPLCNSFAATIDNIRLLKNAERSAQIDGLTSLYNRTYFETQLSRVATEGILPFSIIIGDVNGLKITNDVFGHLEGDKILLAISKILRSSCSDSDVVARWGGDEFIILLPGSTCDQAQIICDAIQEKCTQVNLDTVRLSLSLGCATQYEREDDVSATIKRAESLMYHNKMQDREGFRKSFLLSLQRKLHEKCFESMDHIRRMDTLATELGRFLRLSLAQIKDLQLLVMLHDIGKVTISQDILGKPADLCEEEWIEVRKHPEFGYRIAQTSAELAPVANDILCHHEYWNGEGYPFGKKGTEIPLLARIVAIIDAYDAMTNDRPYREAISHEEALLELIRCSGSQFDPNFVNAFCVLFKESPF